MYGINKTVMSTEKHLRFVTKTKLNFANTEIGNQLRGRNVSKTLPSGGLPPSRSYYGNEPQLHTPPNIIAWLQHVTCCDSVEQNKP